MAFPLGPPLEHHGSRPAWEAAREVVPFSVGASSAAGPLKLDPWSTLYQWVDKKRNPKPFYYNDYMKIGHESEDLIALWLQRNMRKERGSGYKVMAFDHSTFRDAYFPWAVVSPDAICFDPTEKHQWGGGEFKTGRDPSKWGAPRDFHTFDVDEIGKHVPINYAVQCQYTMAVSRAPWWDLVYWYPHVVNGKLEYTYMLRYRFYADFEWQRWAMNEIARVRQAYLLGNEQPPLDHTNPARRFVIDKSAMGEQPRAAAQDEVAIAAQMQQLLAQKTMAHKEYKRLESVLMERMNGVSAINDPFGSAAVHWHEKGGNPKLPSYANLQKEHPDILAVLQAQGLIGTTSVTRELKLEGQFRA